MSNKGQLLQDPFLNTLRREHVPVSIYLVNGIKLQGQIESFDQYVVLLRNTVTQMVYKHAISTIVPGRAVNFSAAESDEAGAPDRHAARRPGACRAFLNFESACLNRFPARTAPPFSSASTSGLPHFDAELEELGLLAQTAGLEPVARLVCKRKAPDAALFVGSGKADEIKALAEDASAPAKSSSTRR